MRDELAWDDLRCFLAVAEAGSFSAAARTLDVEHTTLSRRIAALERRIGHPLFQRTRDGVRPSRAGAELLELARQVQERMRAVERRLAEMSAPDRVKVATSSILASGLLAPHVARLLSTEPVLSLELMVARALVKLTHGEADLALRLRPPGAAAAEPSVIVSVLARVGWAAYGTSSAAPAAITYSGPTRPGASWVEAQRLPTRCAVDDVPTAFSMAQAGLGVAVLPCVTSPTGNPRSSAARRSSRSTGWCWPSRARCAPSNRSPGWRAG